VFSLPLEINFRLNSPIVRYAESVTEKHLVLSTLKYMQTNKLKNAVEKSNEKNLNFFNKPYSQSSFFVNKIKIYTTCCVNITLFFT